MDPSSLSGLPFGIGSLPLTDPEDACELVLEHFPLTPFWPELPRRDWREAMGYIQTEGLPGIVVDAANRKIFLDTQRDLSDDLADFYQYYVSGQLDALAMTPTYAAGLWAMLQAVAIRADKPLLIKGQLSGPTTFGLILKNREGRAMLYNDQLMDVLVKGTVLKAKWMAREIRRTGVEPVIFFDEPMLQSVGSAAVPIDRDRAVAYLTEVADGVDCLTGAHCCGNTDWSILMASRVDILAFDAFDFADTLALYPSQLSAFLNRGGLVAWGIVPASPAVADQSAVSLTERLERVMATIAGLGIDGGLLRRASLVTPSCGLGSLDESTAKLALRLTKEVSDLLRG